MDWETERRQQSADEQNRLLREQNELQEQALWQQRDRQIAEERRYEEEVKRREKKDMKDKIHQLQILLAQTTDPIPREQLQPLLDEAVDEYETYLYRLQKEEEERQRQQQLFEKEQLKRRRRERIKSIIVTMVTIPILLLVFVIGMNWLLKKDAKKEVFGTRTSASSVITSPDRNNDQAASSSSRLNVNSTQTSSNSKVNTKDLTTEQVKKWVTYSIYSIEHEHATIENIEVSMRDDGLVYAAVRLTDERLNSGLSRTYRISSEGYLEEESGFSGWKIISKDYHE